VLSRKLLTGCPETARDPSITRFALDRKT
jgi:hypothetical protein